MQARRAGALAIGLFVLVAGVAAAGPGQGATPAPPPLFGGATDFPVGGYPGWLVTADFNRDGKNDIAASVSGGVAVALGLGNGVLGAPTAYAGIADYGLAAGDFDNDGNIDLLALNYSVGSVLLGTGRGTFPTRKLFSLYQAYDPGSIVAADFNGDGNLDLATVGFNSKYVVVAYGRGDASFVLPTTNYYVLTEQPADIRSGDLSGNGPVDLAVSLGGSLLSSNGFCVLRNRGDGTFAPPAYYAGTTGQPERHNSLELGDFNGDGTLDAALLNYNAGAVTIRLNNGHGSFGPPSDYLVGFSPSSIAAADFNGDATLDLIVRGGSSARLLLGHGDGSFTVGALVSVPADNGFARGTVAVGNFSGEGRPDLALENYPSNSVAIMVNETPPILAITPMGGYNQVSWLATFGAGFSLEYTTNLFVPAAWQPFPYPPVWVGNQKAVADWAGSGRRFYRLRKP